MAQYGPQLWFYATGDPAANQPAAVFGPGDQNTFAAIYSDPAMTAPLPNPTTTDANGNLEFYAADGIYWIFVGPVGTGDSIMINLGASGGQVLSVNGISPDGDGNVQLDAEDVGAIPESIIDAKGDLIVGSASDTAIRLPVGANGRVLAANSGQPGGVEWIPAPGGAVDSVNGQTGDVTLGATDVGAVAAVATPDIVYGTTTGGAVSNRGVSTIASSSTVAVRTAAQQLRSVTVPDGDPAAMTTDLTSRAYVAAIIATRQPLSTIDAAGDLYVGTGPDATTRLPAGADGQVLSSNSATSTGLEWVTPLQGTVESVNGVAPDVNGNVELTPDDLDAVATTTAENVVYGTTTAGAPLNREISTVASPDTVAWRTSEQQLRALTVADNSVDAQATDLTNRSYVASAVNAKLPFAVAPRADEYFQASGVITVRTAKAATLNVMYLYPIPVMSATTLTGVAWETTTTVANSVVRLGLYGASVTGHGVGDLIADFGTFATDTTGVVAAVVSQAMGPGLYWLAFTPQVAVPNFRYGAGWNPYVGSSSFPNGTGTGWDNCYFQTSVSGALPTTPTLDGSTDAPVVGVKYA